MSEEVRREPVLDEEGKDTETIHEEKDYAGESTGPKDDYQKVPGTNKTIGPDGRVYTQQPVPQERPPQFPPAEGGLSVHFPDVNIDVGDIHAPDLSITEPLLNVDIPQPLVDINITEPLIEVDIPELPDKIVDLSVVGPLIDIPAIPEWPEIPEDLVNIVGPLIDIPAIPEWPEIPEDLVNIVGPLIEIPPIPEWPEFPEIPSDLVHIEGPLVDIPEDLITIGDINMPEVVGIDLPEIPEPILWGGLGVGLIIGIGVLLLGVGSTAGALKGMGKRVLG